MVIFKVTHINEAGHRRCARVSARNVADAIDQSEALWGLAMCFAFVRLQPPAPPVGAWC